MKKLDYLDDGCEINMTGYKEVLGIWMRQIAKLGKWKVRR